MKYRRILVRVGGALIVAAFLLNGTASARPLVPRYSPVELAIDGGFVDASVEPDHGGPLHFVADGRNRWAFQGSTSALVGGPYSIRLRNLSPHRIKVVVAVDGLNVYRRAPLGGRSDLDVGSILSPWEERVLTGWQLDYETAQRFVFSPPDWSEARGRDDASIGLIAVQVYRERQPVWERERDAATFEQHKSRQDRSDGCSPGSRPDIGTTSGDDVTSRVRTVRFDAMTTYPAVWAEINYGQVSSPVYRPPYDLLGVDVESAGDGVRIRSVDVGSPAAEAGLEPGDVIIGIDGERGPSLQTVTRILESKRRGDRVFVSVLRGRHEVALKIRV